MSFDIEDLKEHNSELLEFLTEHLPDMLWVKDIDGNYLYVNKAICNELLMAKDTQEPVGKKDIFFALREREAHKEKERWHTFGELCANSDHITVENNKPMRFEEYGNVKGKLLYLEVHKAPFYDKNGNILGTVGTGRDITELKNIQKNLEENLAKLDYQANHDSLTKLPNRILFMDRLEQSIKYAQRNKAYLAIIFLDLDNFKTINDTFGHSVGDKILIEASNRMHSKMRKSDTLARIGGDEFCIILNDIKNISDILEIVKNGIEIFQEPFVIENYRMDVTISVGVAIFPDNGEDASTLLKNADAAMYRAKQSGKNKYNFFDEEMTNKAVKKILLEVELKNAFENDELLVYYQPQINAKTNELIGIEALARWNHPTEGIIFPEKFIPMAKDSAMIVQLDRIIMKKAVKQFSLWKEDGLHPGKLSMNITMQQINSEDFCDFFKELLAIKNISNKDLVLEITENEIMSNAQASIKTLEKLDQLDISIAIDDFGTGYSSLSYLKKLPIDKFKIDKSFVDGLPYNEEDVSLCKTMISLSKNLNVDIIAEGVENSKQRDFLLKNACQEMQGYLYSEAVETKQMTKIIREYTHE